MLKPHTIFLFIRFILSCKLVNKDLPNKPVNLFHRLDNYHSSNHNHVDIGSDLERKCAMCRNTENHSMNLLCSYHCSNQRHQCIVTIPLSTPLCMLLRFQLDHQRSSDIHHSNHSNPRKYHLLQRMVLRMYRNHILCQNTPNFYSNRHQFHSHSHIGQDIRLVLPHVVPVGFLETNQVKCKKKRRLKNVCVIIVSLLNILSWIIKRPLN